MVASILVSGCCGCSGIFPIVASKGKMAPESLWVGVAFVIMALIGLAVAAMSVWWRIVQRPSYGVVICTAAGENRAYVTRDEDEVERIIGALNDAITERG
jgi:Na+/serine symporter